MLSLAHSRIYKDGIYGDCPLVKFQRLQGSKMRDSKKLMLLGNLGVGGERGDVFSTESICPSQSATQYKDAIKILVYMSATSTKVASVNSEIFIVKTDYRQRSQPEHMDIV